MTENTVKYHIPTTCVSLAHQFTQIIFGTEIGVDRKEIVSEIAGSLQLLTSAG